MKLILVSTFLIVGAASARKQSAQSAGLRGQHKVEEGGSNEQRDLQSILFGGSSGGFNGAAGGGTDLLFQCTDACSDQAACSSFMMAFNPTSLYKDACNTGCFPQAKLQTCQQMCQQNVSEPWEEDEAPTSPAAVAVARLGFFDSAVEMMCSDCKFYECCSASSSVDEGVVTSPAKRSTKYESCMVHLPESLDDQAFGDSVLDQIAASLGDALNTITESFEESNPGGLNITQALDAAMGGDDIDLDAVMDQIVGTASEAIDSITEALDLPEWNMTDPQATQEWLDNLDWNAILESFGLSDMFEDLQTLLNDTMADFNTMPVSCDANNCPIDGLCDMSVDMASLNVDDICKKDAFFQCGGGLQQMCLDECSGDTDGFAPLCSLCNVATCCQEKEFGDDTTFEKCVSASVPEDLVQDDSSEAAKDSPVEDSTSRLNGGPSDGLQFGSSASSLGDPVEAESDILQSEATPADDADLLNSNIGPVESNTLEVSGSSVSATRLYVSLAAIATLMFASL